MVHKLVTKSLGHGKREYLLKTDGVSLINDVRCIESRPRKSQNAATYSRIPSPRFVCFSQQKNLIRAPCDP